MKKILSIILSIIMILSIFFAVPSYATEETMQEEMKATIEILRAFDIIPEYHDYNVNVTALTTRADFVNSAAKLINLGEYKCDTVYYYDVPKTHWAYNGICALTEKGIVNGVGDKLFKPDEYITYEEAYKILLSVLGYGEVAENNGGFSVGYVKLANTTGLSKGVEASGNLTLGDAFTLLYNAMLTEVFEATVFGDRLVYETSDETILSIYHNVYYETGVVTGAGGITLSGGRLDKDSVEIDEIKYKTEILLTDYLGMEIELLYHYDKSLDTKTIIWALETGASDVLEIEVDNDASFDEASFVLSYYDKADNKIKRVQLSRTMNVVYNGDVVTAGVDKVLKKDRYTIKLIKNNPGDCETAIVRSYENILVSGVSAATEVVYDALTPGKSISLDENKYEFMKLTNSAGANISFSSIQIDNVLSVYSSLGGDYLEVIVNDSKVTGVVEKIKKGEFGAYITIGGVEYYLRSNDIDFSVGDNLTAYLDISEEIIYYDVEPLKAFAGYMINAVVNNYIFNNTIQIKLLHEAGNIGIYECAEKVEVDGIKYTEADSAYSALCRSGKFTGQIALFETDKDGKIKSIDTAYNGNGAADSLRVNVEYTRSVHSKVNGVLGTVGVADGNTVIFSVPENEELADDDDYAVMSKNEIPEDGRLNIETYKTKEEVGFEEYIVVRGYVPSSSNSTPILVTGFGTRANREGEIVEFIEGYQGTAAISLNATEDVSFEGLTEGMIIRASKDRNGDVISVSIIYDYRNPEKYVSGSDINAMNRPANGYVNNVVDGVIKIGYTDPEKVDQVMYTTNVPVMVYDTKADRNKVYVGSISDAETYKNAGQNCSKVFMVSTYLTPQLFILFI